MVIYSLRMGETKVRFLHSRPMTKKQIQKAFYKRHRARLIQARTARKKALREWLRRLKECLKCERCGFGIAAALQFHHKNPATKIFDVGQAISLGQSVAAIEAEIAKV